MTTRRHAHPLSSAIARLRSPATPLALLAILCAAATAHAASVTIISGNLTNDIPGKSAPVILPAIPLNGVVGTITFNGEYSTSTYNFSNSAFSIDMTHSRAGIGNAFAESLGSVFFSVDGPLTYSASGFYNATDSSGVVGLFSGLKDLTTNSTVFNVDQESQNTPNASFVLGGALGDFSNTNTGTLTGTLIAGHQYQWTGAALIEANPHADSGATATGNVTLTFSDPNAPTATPLPAAAWSGFSVLALIGVAAFTKRRQLSPT